jgi:hypothetical protein
VAHIRAPSVASEAVACIAFTAAEFGASDARGTIPIAAGDSGAQAARRMARLILTRAPTRSPASDGTGSRCANLRGLACSRVRRSKLYAGSRGPGRPAELMDYS